MNVWLQAQLYSNINYKNTVLMKLIKFEGLKINEYLEININFNDDLTILTGINGSGKTTSLNLIQAILLPKIQDLFSIPFEIINLELEHNNKIYIISICKNKEQITFDVSQDKFRLIESLSIPLDIFSDFEIYNISKIDNKKIDFLLRKFQDEPFFQFINRLNKPTLIGLERTSNDITDDYKDYLYERSLFIRNEKTNNRASNKTNLGISTLETEMLVQNVYKRVKEIRDNYYKEINKELISSSFDFTEFSIDDVATNYFDISEKFKLLEKKDEIEETLKSIGFINNDLSKKLRLFFEKIEIVLKKIDGKDNKFMLEWILNKSQLDKLHKVINIIDDYNLKATNIFEPVNKFLDIINSFLKDSGKKIQIDSVGRLLIVKPHGRSLTIDELSSGERQLVVLFANVIFGKYSPRKKLKSDVFIIDEPEISLHIRWQENFVTSLLSASSNTQFIIASHSPDIIGEYKFKSERINKIR